MQTKMLDRRICFVSCVDFRMFGLMHVEMASGIVVRKLGQLNFVSSLHFFSVSVCIFLFIEMKTHHFWMNMCEIFTNCNYISIQFRK